MTEILHPQSRPYALLEVLGEGLNSRVYKALRQDPMGHVRQVVALKILNSETLVDLWRREFETLVKVRSPFCVSLLGWEWLQARPALVLEYVEGVTLERFLKGGERLSPIEAEDLLWQIQRGLQDLNASGLCHGDLSPNNVLIGVAGDVRLVDFGLANTRAGHLFFTPAYAAPEVISGSAPNSFSDHYSLGRIARDLETLTGECAALRDLSTAWLAPEWHSRILVEARAFPEVRSHIGQKVEALRIRTRTLTTRKAPCGAKVRDRGGRRWLAPAALAVSLMATGPWPHAQVPAFSRLSRLSIRTRTWASISVNGSPWGYAPLDRWLPPGTYSLEVQTAQGPVRRTLTLTGGKHILLVDKDFSRGRSGRETGESGDGRRTSQKP